MDEATLWQTDKESYGKLMHGFGAMGVEAISKFTDDEFAKADANNDGKHDHNEWLNFSAAWTTLFNASDV